MFSKQTLLVVAAHPDDEVLGCGGTIAKLSKEGHNVHVLIMAEGVTARDNIRDTKIRKKELSHIAKSAKNAGKILGVQSVELLNYPDNRMDGMDLLKVVKAIENHIEKLKPNVIATHHSNDLNIDHQIVHRAVITACRSQPGHPVKRILSFEVASATEWQSPTVGNSFFPNWFEDISDTLELKRRALEIYVDEMREWPHSRSLKALDHLAKWRGATVGVNAAEAFILVKEIR